MATTKEYNVKLKSLKNTQKITKTMKMISASKLRKFQQAQANAKIYANSIRHLVSRIAVSVDSSCHPLLQARAQVKNILIVLVTSDRGLCGAFNNNVNKQVLTWISHNNQYEKIDLVCCGKRGHLFFQKKANINKFYKDSTPNPTFETASRIGDDLSKIFISGEYDEVYVTHNQFFSPLLQKTIFKKILPVDPRALSKEGPQYNTDYIFEPRPEELLTFLISQYLFFRIYFTLLENAAGEHGARMTAMDNATKNASELIEKYTLLRNRARQAAITTELIEIVAGAEALK